jgi:hypothetical protein
MRVSTKLVLINGVGVVNFVTSKNLMDKSTMFPHCNIHKLTWMSPNGKAHNKIDNFFIDRRKHSSTLDARSFRAADCDTDHYQVVAKFRERLAVSKQTNLHAPWVCCCLGPLNRLHTYSITEKSKQTEKSAAY